MRGESTGLAELIQAIVAEVEQLLLALQRARFNWYSCTTFSPEGIRLEKYDFRRRRPQ
jgi:hypothetical protein